MTGQARALFDELTSSGTPEERWARVEKLVTDATPESLWLDFKTCARAAEPSKDDFIRDGFARALSGFANMEGGVLVYGIKTTPKSSGKNVPDVATAIELLPAPDVFCAQLEKLASRVVDPPIVGLSVESIAEPAGRGGVAVVFIPQSTGGPHRVVDGKAESNDRYYARTSTNHIVIPHAQLADMFGRTAQPALELTARLVAGSSPQVVAFDLRNVGRGAARRPAIQIIDAPLDIEPRLNSKLTSGFITKSNARPGTRNLLLEPHEDVVIYPGMELMVAFMPFRGPPEVPVTLRVVLHALDARPIRGSIVVTMPTDKAGVMEFPTTVE